MTDFHLTPEGKKLVTLIPGDGIGPEIVDVTTKIIEATGAPVAWDPQQAGETVFKQGIASGVTDDTIESISKTRVVLKGPLGTPVGFGEKSANVTLRKLFETYANIRPVREFPNVPTPYSGRNLDLVVIRENVEDLYAGIEHMQTPGVAQCLKLISRKGCEKIVRFAFEYARAEGRKSVACATKSNIMKLTEGLLKRTFEEIAPEYPDIEAWHVIVDNAAHQLVKKPEQFDVIVTTNMNGDILSDLTSGLVGGLGFAPSANIGNDVAIFEAVHGSAPKYAGKNVINPTALVLSSVMLLKHLDEFEAAAKIENSLLVTFADGGVLTRDVVGDEAAASTTDFAETIIANLDKKSPLYTKRDVKPIKLPQVDKRPDLVHPETRRVVGVDAFLEFAGTANELGGKLEAITEGSDLKLKIISSRGTRVYPATGAITDSVDAWQTRFVLRNEADELDNDTVLALLGSLNEAGLTWGHIEKLQEFDGELAFTKAQGED